MYYITRSNRFTLFLLFIIGASLFMLTWPQAVFGSIDPSNTTYEIKRDDTNDTEKMLMIVAFYEGEYSEYYKKKYHTLAQILESHWNINITISNETEYRRGMVEAYDVIFYIKEDRERVPAPLLLDLINAKGKQIISSGFTAEFVTTLLKTPIFNEDIAVTEIEYKQVRFVNNEDIFLTFDTSTASSAAVISETFGVARTTKSSSTHPFAFTLTNKNILSTPEISTYLILPFVLPDYYATKSYSTIFLDLLYEGFDAHVATDGTHALLRLEDINVVTYRHPRALRNVYSFLKQEEVPFHIAFIAKYVDPNNNTEMYSDEGRRFYNLLKDMVGEGYGTLIQHGFTHQIDGSVSGIGFEFWDEERDAPLWQDSAVFTLERVYAAQKETARLQLPVPDIWETPHYAASVTADEAFNFAYPIRYEHIKGVGSFPFTVKLDGVIYLPENLGFVSDDSDDFIFGQDLASIEENLKYLEVFRDPTPSIFWHPWRKKEEIEHIVALLKEHGYTFVSAYELLETNESNTAVTALTSYRTTFETPFTYTASNVLIILIYTFFVIGCIFFLRTIVLLRRYQNVFDSFRLTSESLQRMIYENGARMPFFTIFVPARNEGLVIGNTIRRLARIDYPKDSYNVVIIVDERELDDNVSVTTKSVVKEVGATINELYGTNLITYIEVPKWHSGIYNDFSENPQKSTKGRALNFALQRLTIQSDWNRIDMIGVLDADGRIHPNALKEAAYKRVFNNSMVLQGPVLQVSNFSNVSMVGIAAGIELAIHHLTELPDNLLNSKRVQFLAGTNYFIDKSLIANIGGWDQNALVEDAELALRIYARTGIKADWLGSPEIEQTPENFSIYRKQRRRWVRGHLDLLKPIYQAPISIPDKLRFFWKIFVSQFRFILDLGFPLLALLFLFLGMFVDLGIGITILSIILLIFAFFMWDMYGSIYRRIAQYIDPNMTTRTKAKMSLQLFFFSPIFMFVQSIPRIIALYDFARSTPVQWYKTERTAEKQI